MSDETQFGANVVPEHDKLLQATCEAIVTAVAQCVDGEPDAQVSALKLPTGEVVGEQITINATEKGGPLNTCRLSILNSATAPAGEAARIEYEHDKQTKHGMLRVYSVQSVRKRAGELVLLENFLADDQASVREADFKPIDSESYAQQTVYKTLQDWARYRAWQLQQAGSK